MDLLLAHNVHGTLLAHDQLTSARAAGEAFAGFEEGPLHFHPTYKFDKGKDSYDTGPKLRVPAWTDRVLFKAKAGVRLLSYFSVPDLRISDHRPVVATLQMPVLRVWEDAVMGESQEEEEVVEEHEVAVWPPRRRWDMCSVM